MDKLNIIYDTNVIISSLLSGNEDSATVKALDYFYDNKVNLIYSNEIINEYVEVLNREKFSFDKNKIKELISIIKDKGINVSPGKIDEYKLDIKDKPFYELVIDKTIGNKKLVTGNIKHFPNIKEIITPNELVALMEK